MTTRDFIRNTFNTTSTRERRCSSVFADEDGNIYSYGYHYPLLFQVGGLYFVNTTGYSNTTAKHIGWAWAAVDYNAIAVKLNGKRKPETLDTIATLLAAQIVELQSEIDKKKRKDTQVCRDLQAQLEQQVQYIATVMTIKGAKL